MLLSDSLLRLTLAKNANEHSHLQLGEEHRFQSAIVQKAPGPVPLNYLCVSSK